MAEIQRKVIKQSKRNAISRIFHAKNDKEVIAAWKVDLNRILHVFNVRSVVFTWVSLTMSLQTELAVNTHVAVSDMRDDVSKISRGMSKISHGMSMIIRGEVGGQGCPVSAGHI